jgi:hypothetical protein
MGYYDAARGVYVGDSGQSDYDRTIEAIKYYEKNGMTTQRDNAVKYASNQGYTQPGYKPSTTTTTTPKTSSKTSSGSNSSTRERTTTTTPRTSSNNNNTGSNQYYIPYEQELRDLIASYPEYTPLTESQMMSQAQNYADLQVDPQLDALSKALRNAITAAENQTNEVTAAYSGIGATADRLLTEAQRQGEISAIARGGGRSGAVETSVANMKQPIMEQVTQAEAEKAAKLANISNSKTNAQTAYDEGTVALEAQRGRLVAQQLAAIKELDYAKQTGRADAILAATERLAAATNARNQFDNSLLQSYTDMMGEVPGEIVERPVITNPNSNSGGSNYSNEPVGLRAYVESKGGSVGFSSPDGSAMNGTVTINGKSYSATQLIQKGATLVNGSWYIPESVLRGMM